jgi:anti-anti-sigma factor
MPTLALVRGGELVATYRLEGAVVLVGRDDACDITLRGPLVSRRHCRFVASGDTYMVEDLGSNNGTYVNGAPAGQQALREGDRIAVVPHILVYHALDKAPAAAPAATAATAAAGDEVLPKLMATTRIDAAEVNRHLTRLLAEAKPYGFSVSHEAAGDEVDIVSVSGPLDAHTSDGFEEAMNALLAEGRCRLIVDMARVTYLASAGVGALLSAAAEAKAGGGKLVVLSPASQVRETLALGFTDMFTIAADRREALSVF